MIGLGKKVVAFFRTALNPVSGRDTSTPDAPLEGATDTELDAPSVKPSDQPAPKPAPSKELADAADDSVKRMRQTAQWVITLLTALAAFMVAGTQLTSMGNLQGPSWMDNHRLLVAFASGSIALICVGLVIFGAVQVLTVGSATIADLVQLELRRKRTRDLEYVYSMDILKPQESLGVFDQRWWQANKEVENAENRTFDALIGTTLFPDDELYERYLHANELILQRARNKRKSIIRSRRDLMMALRAEIVGRTMSSNTTWMVIAGVIGGIALGTFIWAVNPGGDVPPFQLPTRAIVTLSTEEQEQLRGLLGPCVAEEFTAIVLDAGDEQAQLVPDSTSNCSLAEFSASIDSLRPAERIEIPSAATPGASPAAPIASPEQ